MKKLLCLPLLLCSLIAQAISFTNPILPYDYSDPDVCRVGDKYLMTSSSFNNCPGLQILESEDLVHWEIVDAAIRQQVPGYEEGCKVLGNMVWAPSIREHEGKLYIFYGDPDRGIYCIRADISQGLHYPLAWEEAVLVMPGKGLIDPCPLWDEDGRVYLVHALAGSRAGLKSCLLMAELTEDALHVKEPSRIIFDGHEEHPTCEGPKLYKKNGYYYIMHPAGGVEFGWQVVQRSKHIYGPYEVKITLSQGKSPVNGPHQGAYVETESGEGWFFHFQDVGIAGRIVHLQPVVWKNGWPIMGNNGEPVIQWPKNHGKEKSTDADKPTWSNLVHRDEFDSPTLGLDWQWAGAHTDPRWYYCHSAKSMLRLYTYPQGEELMENMLLQKIPAVGFAATCRVRFTPNTNPKLQGKEEAGMIVFGRKSYRLPIPTSGEWIYLKLEMNDTQVGQFYTSKDGKKWQKEGDAFQAIEGKWIGAQVGLYSTREDKKINDSGYLDVDWFEVTTL